MQDEESLHWPKNMWKNRDNRLRWTSRRKHWNSDRWFPLSSLFKRFKDVLLNLLALQALKHNLKQFRNSKWNTCLHAFMPLSGGNDWCCGCFLSIFSFVETFLLTSFHGNPVAGRACAAPFHVEFWIIVRPFELFVLRCRFAFYFDGAGTAFCEDEQGECDRLRR